MAHSANRSIDFAPAWLKLPEQSQEQKRQESQYNNHHHQSHIQHRNSIGHSNSHSQNTSNQHQLYQQHGHHNQSQAPQQQSYHQSHHNGVNQQQSRPGRPPLNSYSSSFNSRSNSQPILQLHRSQSTGSYNDSARQSAAITTPSTAVVKPKPLEEEFPLLGNSATSSQSSNKVSNTAQWRIKERAREEAKTANQQSDNLLTSNMSGKVYRAQVKPVKRSNMMPISNGTSSIMIKTRENGDDHEHSNLSSSLDREKRFLQELGWNENEESDDDCVIPEQDPAELQQIMMQAKAAREKLLMKSRQTLKSVPTAILPNEDDIPSSSDNSDAE